MKTALSIVAALLVPSLLSASQPRLTVITLPLWYRSSATSNESILIATVPKIHRSADFDSWISLYLEATRPEGTTEDINLISIYKISVAAKTDANGVISEVSLNSTKAAKPDDIPFSVETVVSIAADCIRRDLIKSKDLQIFIIDQSGRRALHPKKPQSDDPQQPRH